MSWILLTQHMNVGVGFSIVCYQCDLRDSVYYLTRQPIFPTPQYGGHILVIYNQAPFSD